MLNEPYTAADRQASRLLSVQSVTTSDIAPRERFEYWRELFRASAIDKPRDAANHDFRGRLAACARQDGVLFTDLQSDPVACGFGGLDSDLILVGYVRAGDVSVETGGAGDAISGRGLVLLDCDRPATTLANRHEITYLGLPRHMVSAAMGADPLPRGELMRVLPAMGLSSLLLAHLDAMARHWHEMDQGDLESAMDAATSMALSMLARLHPQQLERRETLDDVLFASAHRYIHVHAHRAGLTADHIASALGCSRTHLYRLFRKRDQEVGALLREVRLSRARTLIEQRGGESLGTIAFACGYSDLSAFGKAFRRRFGVSPAEHRARCRTVLPG